MIPLRVCLHNFLCHADQEFRFDAHPVWLLHGPNGVGKSAVFDAMLYALFGETKRSDTRKNDLVDVIRHGEKSARVDFEFEHEGGRYCVWRIRSHKKTEQGVKQWTGQDWQQLQNVTSTRDLDHWVKKALKLEYDTFVSAILLRQGAAEKLIDADKDERRNVMRSFIDLEEYVRLHERVVEARKELSSKVRLCRAQLEGMPVVTRIDLAAAENVVREAADRQDAAKTTENDTRDLHGHARAWEKYESERQELQRQLDAARRRLERADELRRQVERLTELRTLVPALRQVFKLREQLTAGEETLWLRSSERSEAASQLEALHSTLKASQVRTEQLRTEVTRLEQEIQKLTSKRKEVDDEIARAEQAADLIKKLEELRSKKFPPNLDEQLATANEAVAEAQAARDALPYVEALVKHRADYQHAASEEAAGRSRVEAAAAERDRLRQEEATARTAAQAAAERTTQLQQEAAVARNQLQEAQERQKRFTATATLPVCSECGQEISAAHARKERAKLKQTVQAATERHQTSEAAARTAAADAKKANQRQQVLVDALTNAENASAVASRDREEAIRRAAMTQAAFDQACGKLDRAMAKRVTAIATDGFPTDSDAEALRKTAGQLSKRTKARDDLETLSRDRDTTNAAIQTQEQFIQTYGAPPDVSAAKARQTELIRQFTALNEQLHQEKSALTEDQEAAEQAGQQQKDCSARLHRLEIDIAKAGEQTAGVRQRFQEAIALLAAPHRARADVLTKDEVDRLEQEQRQLESSQVEKEHEALRDDLACQDTRKQRLSVVTAFIAQVPEPARQPAAELERAIHNADQATQAAARQHQDALNRLHALRTQHEQRENHECELADAEHQHALHDRLVELLGEKRLQLALVRDAEQRIIRQANDILDRLSGGELRFEPPDHEGEKAFEIFVRRVGCPAPIAAANLSGGQRFRVAVALALAVCQGAGDVARPLETIIIDEGFGALDREGRAAMIAELRDGQAMSQLFKKVIVVSHQDDFAAAFPVGYRLSAENGATRVEAFGLSPAAPGEN